LTRRLRANALALTAVAALLGCLDALRQGSVRADAARRLAGPGPPPSGAGGAAEEASALMRYWAPAFVQHVAHGAAGRDHPTRVDFDGDWDTSNNWDNQPRWSSKMTAAVYGSAVLSREYAFLTYTLYYPRDWFRPICLPWLCHDNDLENVLLVVKRPRVSGAAWPGALELVDVKAHKEFRVAEGALVGRDASGRPRLRVEAMGHGIRACGIADGECRAAEGRVVYVPGEAGAPPPRAARGQQLSYELRSTHDELWSRRRPDAALWRARGDETLCYVESGRAPEGTLLGAALKAKRHTRGFVRPPWGVKGRAGSRGDWFLDPARVVYELYPGLARRRRGGFRYDYNPYLESLRADSQPCDSSGGMLSRSAEWGTGVAAMLCGGVLLLAQRLRRLPQAGASAFPRRLGLPLGGEAAIQSLKRLGELPDRRV
jgi:hypothetical protein